jgi:hypothetical protein
MIHPMQEIDQMNEAQLEAKRDNLERYFDSCRAIQQGINTKERLWYNRVCDRLENEFGHSIERWR